MSSTAPDPQHEFASLMMLPVRDAYIRHPFFIDGALDLVSVCRQLSEHGHTDALVRDGARIGMFTTTDLRDALLYTPDLATLAVREVAHFDLIEIHPERELFEADWAEARARCGDAAVAADLARTPKQRRADALRIMAERSAAKPAEATEARVLLQVLVGHESVDRLCELSNGTVVTPGQLLPVLDRAEVERVIFDGPSKVIDVGVRRRLFSGATRTAIHARDRGCTHPSCSEPLDRCQIDHVIPYCQGGLTTQDNGTDQCRFHNHHKGGRPPPQAA